MQLFSARNRPVAAGPLLTERLPRQDTVAARSGSLHPSANDEQAGDHCVQRVLEPIRTVFNECRTADVVDAVAPMPSPAAAADNIKGYGYFLDADLVGICAMPPSAWTGQPIEGHTHAVVILVADRRAARPGEPGYDWISGAGRSVSDLRATEIATVVARYIGTLGHRATAHSVGAEDVDRQLVALHAGVVERSRGGASVPLLPHGHALAVITTSFELPLDRPLAPRSRLRTTQLRLAQAIGWKGSRPGWDRLSGRHRPWYLGRYPMERVRRVDEPTTLVVDNEVTRPSGRHNFFNRAGAGDLGARPQREVQRFVAKAPHGLASQEMLGRLVPHQRGPVAPEIASHTSDHDDNADALKALTHFLGADMAGICEVPTYAWYSHDDQGRPIEPRHRNAVVFVLDQGYDTMEGASGDDWISGAQSMRAYLRSSVIACAVAAQIRSLGWSAQAHTAANDEVTHIPLLLRAGIGELSRIGELVLNPFVGPRFKSGVVTTDMPLRPDRPIDFGLQDFCGKCTKCARECPCGAIRFGDKTMFNGYEMWKPDVDRCARYRTTNMRGSACGRCMKTCPYNVEGILAERPFQWAAARIPASRRMIARLDDRFRRGSINPVKKWWVDIEMVDGVPVAPPKGANARGLTIGRKPRDEAGYAIFPSEIAPPNDHGPSVFPLDRDAGIAAARTAESPDDARKRVAR